MWHVNFFAVLISAAIVFVLGGLWYAPWAFGSLWQKASAPLSDTMKKGHRPQVYVVAFIFALVAAVMFGIVLGPNPGIWKGIIVGLSVGFCFVAMSFGINYLFAGRSLTLLWIDGGYHVVQFLLYGLIFGLMQ